MAQSTEILPNGLQLLQDDRFFKLGQDSVLLSAFAKPRRNAKLLDLGCGTGALALLVWRPDLKITGLELQDGPLDLFRQSITANELENVTALQGDLRQMRTLLPHGSMDYVICNPPYFDRNAGANAPTAEKRTARQNATCSVEELAVAASFVLHTGGETMQKYADAAGLTKSIKVDGIQSSVGKFDFSGNDNQLAWSGVGQGQDTLCPINMLQYMGAIANGGKAAVPRLIEKSTTDYGLPTGIYYPHKSAQLIDEKTAGTIADMMHNNVIETYGQDRFPGMDICAKSGTAEVGADKSPNAWFTGFLRDEATPYAFIVLVENGGGGSSVAGTVASQVLQAAVEKAY